MKTTEAEKEIDVKLVREIEKFMYHLELRANTPPIPDEYIDDTTIYKIAQHFFELGQKAEEEMLDKSLDEAAEEYSKRVSDGHNYRDLTCGFIAGAKWMAGQGVTLKVTDDTTWGEVNDFIHRNCDGVKEIHIRKKEESK